MNTIIVTNATYLQDYQINIEFSDHSSRVIDFEPFLKENPHPQWNKYNNLNYFKKFKIENGNLVWGRNWDLIFPVYGLFMGNLLEPCSNATESSSVSTWMTPKQNPLNT
jgi:hypothetical protein